MQKHTWRDLEAVGGGKRKLQSPDVSSGRDRLLLSVTPLSLPTSGFQCLGGCTVGVLPRSSWGNRAVAKTCSLHRRALHRGKRQRFDLFIG